MERHLSFYIGNMTCETDTDFYSLRAIWLNGEGRSNDHLVPHSAKNSEVGRSLQVHNDWTPCNDTIIRRIILPRIEIIILDLIFP